MYQYNVYSFEILNLLPLGQTGNKYVSTCTPYTSQYECSSLGIYLFMTSHYVQLSHGQEKVTLEPGGGSTWLCKRKSRVFQTTYTINLTVTCLTYGNGYITNIAVSRTVDVT